MIHTRHIRKDWKNFLDRHDSATVSTMCGSRTRPALAGIPGISRQEPYVEVGGRFIMGWCLTCCIQTLKEIDSLKVRDTAIPEVAALHDMVRGRIAHYEHTRPPSTN